VDGRVDGANACLLAATLAPLDASPRRALSRLASLAFRAVQLDATQQGLRPRELDRSARRDLMATLRRHDLLVSGIDAWIPPDHFTDPARVDRAVTTVLLTIALAGDLGRCPVSLALPAGLWAVTGSAGAAGRTLLDHADHHGVTLVDHAVPPGADDRLGVGVDPAAWLAVGEDPAAAVLAAGVRLKSVRLCDRLTTGVRGPIGDPRQGQLDVAAYREAMAMRAWAEPVVVDAREWTDPWAGLVQTMAVWA
jgi:sugar phosphate isomerase/epimerase